MPDYMMGAFRVAKEWGIAPMDVLLMPNYLYIHAVEYMEIQVEVDWLAQEQARLENGNHR